MPGGPRCDDELMYQVICKCLCRSNLRCFIYLHFYICVCGLFSHLVIVLQNTFSIGRMFCASRLSLLLQICVCLPSLWTTHNIQL